MSYKSEFPDFDDVFPDFFPLVDQSWHSDAMPSFAWEDTSDQDLSDCRIVLWCDFLQPQMREIQSMAAKRFRIVVQDRALNIIATPVAAESIDLLREKCNVWYLENVGYRPDSEQADIPIGELVCLVGQLAYLHKQ